MQIGSQIHLTFDSKLSCIDLLLSWSRLESYPKKKSFMVYPESVEDIAVVWVRIKALTIVRASSVVEVVQAGTTQARSPPNNNLRIIQMESIKISL